MFNLLLGCIKYDFIKISFVLEQLRARNISRIYFKITSLYFKQHCRNHNRYSHCQVLQRCIFKFSCFLLGLAYFREIPLIIHMFIYKIFFLIAIFYAFLDFKILQLSESKDNLLLYIHSLYAVKRISLYHTSAYRSQ